MLYKTAQTQHAMDRQYFGSKKMKSSGGVKTVKISDFSTATILLCLARQ